MKRSMLFFKPKFTMKIKQMCVLVHPFYSLSLKLVSQASIGSQDIHTSINFTDPLPFHSFETTSFSKNIHQYQTLLNSISSTIKQFWRQKCTYI